MKGKFTKNLTKIKGKVYDSKRCRIDYEEK